MTQSLYGHGFYAVPQESPELALRHSFIDLFNYDPGVKPCCYTCINGLTEPFTAKPVVILSRDLAKKLRLTPDGEITATTVTSSGKLETADVEYIEVDGQRFESVRVAVSPKNFEGYKIILNCALKEAA